MRNNNEYLSGLFESFHIACFSETHSDTAKDSGGPKLEVFDKRIRRDRTRNDGGRMVYIASILKYRRKDDLENPQI